MRRRSAAPAASTAATLLASSGVVTSALQLAPGAQGNLPQASPVSVMLSTPESTVGSAEALAEVVSSGSPATVRTLVKRAGSCEEGFGGERWLRQQLGSSGRVLNGDYQPHGSRSWISGN